MLARRYGGATYDKVASKVAQHSHSINEMVTPVTTQSPENDTPIREEDTELIEVPKSDT